MKKPQPSPKIGASHKSKKICVKHLPSKVLRHKALAGLLALPIFNSSSQGTYGAAVTFYIEDTIPHNAESELQLRGSFRLFLMNSIHQKVRNSLFMAPLAPHQNWNRKNKKLKSIEMNKKHSHCET
jgi:hypothetical protein